MTDSAPISTNVYRGKPKELTLRLDRIERFMFPWRFQMKTQTKERIKAALLAAGIITAMALLGALEQAAGFIPNH